MVFESMFFSSVLVCHRIVLRKLEVYKRLTRFMIEGKNMMDGAKHLEEAVDICCRRLG